MSTEKRRIIVSLPAKILKDVEWLAPLEDITRDELILVAIERFLKPHLAARGGTPRISGAALSS